MPKKTRPTRPTATSNMIISPLNPGQTPAARMAEMMGGDLAGLEATLTAQAVALNAMFTQLAHRTATMTIVDQIDRFTRLALKAQGQCGPRLKRWR